MRMFTRHTSWIWIAMMALCVAAANATPTDPMRINSPPNPYGFQPLKWGSVNPTGWLLDWATDASLGSVSPTHGAFHVLSTPSKPTDGWKDGRPDFGGFWDEDSAYWIDGMTRLGFVLNDSVLLQRVREDFEYVMANPYNFHNTYKGDVIEGWVRSIYSRGMLAWIDGAEDKEVLEFLVKSYSNYTAFNSTMSTDQSHQGSRSMTQMEALFEGYAYGGPESMVKTGLSLMGPGARNGGYDFLETLLSGCLSNRTAIVHGACEQFAHGVTFNEVAKLFAMAYSWSGNKSHLAASVGAYEMMEKYDMQPHGVNSADEDMNGISPNLATETCDVSDFIYSTSWMLRVTGDAKYGDRLERAFHNAAPGAVNRTFSGHVYFQAPNLINSQIYGNHNNLVNNPEKYEEELFHQPPCCTGNQARMLPNYIHHMWFATKDNGLAVTMYGPNRVRTLVGKGSTVIIESTTDYPFAASNMIEYKMSFEDENSVDFPILFRVPEWTSIKNMTVLVNGDTQILQLDGQHRGFIRILRTWQNGDVVQVMLPMSIKATLGTTINNGWVNMTMPRTSRPAEHSHRLHTLNSDLLNAGFNSPILGGGHRNVTSGLSFCVVSRGPLLFALPMETQARGSTYQYAIQCDASTMEVSGKGMSNTHFDWPLDAPIKISVKASEFDWEDPWLLPDGPIPTKEENIVPLTLIPYGNAKQFHISMFPHLDTNKE